MATMNKSKENLASHSNVRFGKLPFFNVVATLMEPATLIPNQEDVNEKKWETLSYHFHLTPQQITDIANDG